MEVKLLDTVCDVSDTGKPGINVYRKWTLHHNSLLCTNVISIDTDETRK